MPPNEFWEKILTFKVEMKKEHLTREPRYTISCLYKQGCSQKKIAQTIEKNKSVVSRELNLRSSFLPAMLAEVSFKMRTFASELFLRKILFLGVKIYLQQLMSAYIVLDNMLFHANHGVFPQETLVGNTFIVHLKIKADLSEAIANDRLEDTINYAAMFDVVKKEMSQPSKLLEHVAGRIIAGLKQHFPQIEEVELKLSKQHPPVNGQMESAGVIITG
jgi:dihydroneopterin aldolase